VVARAVAEDPRDRYADGVELAREIGGLLSTSPRAEPLAVATRPHGAQPYRRPYMADPLASRRPAVADRRRQGDGLLPAALGLIMALSLIASAIAHHHPGGRRGGWRSHYRGREMRTTVSRPSGRMARRVALPRVGFPRRRGWRPRYGPVVGTQGQHRVPRRNVSVTKSALVSPPHALRPFKVRPSAGSMIIAAGAPCQRASGAQARFHARRGVHARSRTRSARRPLLANS